MKRFTAIALILCLCLSFTGCKALDYSKASRHYKKGQYAQALELYTSLGDYADSEAMAHLSWQKADYEAAGESYAGGDYRRAMELYYGLGMYMDSPVKAIESQYQLGLALIESGEYGEAIDLLQALGTYSDSARHAQKAMELWLCQSLTELGGVTMPLDEAGQQKLLLVTTGAGTVDVIYIRESMLLGLPSSCRFTLTVFPATQVVGYRASYLSVAASTILEESSGLVDPAVFSAGRGLSTYVFTQTITEPDGTVSITNDTTDAIILQSLLPEASAVIAENLAVLLAQSGTDLTPEDLGFISLG